MNQPLQIFSAILLLCASLFSQQANAQNNKLSLKIPAISNASAGQVLKLPITVSNFDSVVAMQFVLRWDTTVLQFQSVDKFNLPSFDDSDIGTVNARDSGFVRVVWEFYTNAGTSLADGTAIFYLNLKVVGPVNSGTKILFKEEPPLTYFEITKAGNPGPILTQKDVEIFNGFAAVGYSITSTSDAALDLNLQVFPNPFCQKLNLKFTLPTAAKTSIQVADLSGKIIFEKTDYFKIGTHGMEIDFPVSLPNSQYFLIVSTNTFRHAVQLNSER